jgi:hypothetical protein
VPVDNPPHIGQSDAGALEFIFPLKPLEHPEELVCIGQVESRPVVADDNHGFGFIRGQASDFDPSIKRISAPSLHIKVENRCQESTEQPVCWLSVYGEARYFMGRYLSTGLNTLPGCLLPNGSQGSGKSRREQIQVKN